MSINLVYIGSSRLFLIGLNVKYFQPCGSFGLLFSKWAWLACFLVKSLSHVWLFVTPWTVAYQAPPSMGFSRQECWSGLPFPSPGDLPDQGIEPGSPTLQADALPSEPPEKHTFSLWKLTFKKKSTSTILLRGLTEHRADGWKLLDVRFLFQWTLTY